MARRLKALLVISLGAGCRVQGSARYLQSTKVIHSTLGFIRGGPLRLLNQLKLA